MAKQPEDQNDPTEQVDRTEVIPQQPDDTALIDADDTARLPFAPDVPVAPSAGGAPLWASAAHEPAEPVAGDDVPVAALDGAAAAPGPVGPVGPAPVAAATSAKGSPWWKGRLALAGGALAAGLLLGGAVGATAAVAAIDSGDHVAPVGEGLEGGRGGFGDEDHPPGGRHGGGRGEMPGQGQLPGGGQGQGQLPGGETSTDPNGTSEST